MQNRKLPGQTKKLVWVEPKKRGGPRAGAGRKATGVTPQVSLRLGGEEKDAFDNAPEGGAPYLRRLIREDLAGSKISRQALLDWISEWEAEHGPCESLTALRAKLETL